MQENLKAKTVSGMIWSALQRFGTMGISFVSNIVLARLLTPDDYGCIGMLAIFITVSNTFVDGGFGSALIQKKEPTQKDYSTIFWWNLFLSIVIYGILYLSAPAVSRFYDIPLLSSVLRVQGIVLIINALNIVQTNQLRKSINFKRLATIHIVSHIIGAGCAIVLAYMDWGVWALVAQQIIASSITSVMLWVMNRWLPQLCFSLESFKQLFSFGGFILASNLINTFCDNIQGLLIGKFFNPAMLGLYTQSRKLEEIATNSISGVVNQVAYPVLSKKQSDKNGMITALKRFITFIAFIVFPLMLLLIVIAEPLITLVYSAKWLPCVPYFRILCIAGLAISLQMINYNAIAAIGKSNVLFKWTIIKRTIGLVLNIGGLLLFGIYGLLWGSVLTSYTLYFINAYLVSKHVGYNAKDQLVDLFPIISISIVTFLISFITYNFVGNNNYIVMLMIIGLFIVVYLLLSKIFNKLQFSEFIYLTKDIIKHKK